MTNPRYAELLTILKQAPSTGYSTKEIFKIASGNLKTLIPDPDETSRMVYKLRIDGAISTSDGKQKMYKITNKGLRDLEIFDYARTKKGTTDEALEAPKSSKCLQAADSAPVLEPVAQNQTEKALLEPVCNEEAPKTVASEQNASVPAIAFNNAIETLARDGYMILDPTSESDAFICDLVNRLKWPKLPALTNKAEKIATMVLVRQSIGQFNSDVDDILGDIISDLEGLSAA